MLVNNNISIDLKYQQFECNTFNFNHFSSCTELTFNSVQKPEDVVCPVCGKPVYAQNTYTVTLKDAPLFVSVFQNIYVNIHRYQCTHCGKTFTEDNVLKYPGTRVTVRAADWIKAFLRCGLSIKDVSDLTGIHWETICNIHKAYMDEIIENHENYLKRIHYKPKYLAVDEFAIHKGHTYATSVMDIETGDIIWVGRGRTKDSFGCFFMETDPDILTDVKAVAMDMNASYNALVERYLPYAEIVYDRYHMQAQYGKDVLGAVRLQEAREHQNFAKEIDLKISQTEDVIERRMLKQLAREERTKYSTLKNSRWALLTNSSNLNENKLDSLSRILSEHEKLAVCYAMREEMCRLFTIRDETEAEQGWIQWFEAARQSNIPQLIKFANLKEKRLPGLIAHARHPISTGKIEGYNNKIKVAKRNAYGYRNDDYFFTLIRYSSIPSWFVFHKKT